MKSSQNHIPSLLSALTFIVGALFLFGIALVMGIGALASFFRGTDVPAQQTIFLVAFGFEGIILLTATFFSFQKFLQRPSADQNVTIPSPAWLIALSVIVAAASILIGYQISEIEPVAWILLPILTIPAIVLPLGVLLAFGIRKLPFGRRWQTWSVLGLAMSLAPLMLFIIETLVAIVIFFVIIVYVMAQPELASQLEELSQQIMILGPDSEVILDLLSPYLTNPAVIVTALIYMAVLVPAVEEIFKPLGVWLFAGKLESRAQGFALGALSGAGYALIETIGVSGQTTEWATLLFTRIGTGLLHITTSALMGGAIFLAWHERRYLRFIGIYFLAILLHGLWNTAAILFTFSSVAEMLEQEGRLSTIQPALVVAMSGLAVGLFLILVRSNWKLRKTVLSPSTQPALPDESVETGEVAKETS
ncbi:MAG: PrsW family intramembrane metalloprotease [Chloroflexi bacterium]|nr:MAG: PrsW family intramembrane metalloprotease [Chloroflexota bacterium]